MPIEPRRGDTFGFAVARATRSGFGLWLATTKQGLTPLPVLCRPFGAGCIAGRTAVRPYNALFQFLKNLAHLCL